jgi:UDP-glucose 4-epimerase
MKHILVTGGAGFIGSHMVDKLINRGDSVTIFDNLSTGSKKYCNPKATFIKGDVANKKQVEQLFKNPFDVVFHIAGCASSIKSFIDTTSDVTTNYIGTTNIVTECIKHKIPRLLYASSMTVYGNIDKLPIKETTPARPISYYGISKYAAERFVHASSERVDLLAPLSVTSFRMFNVYGPRQSLTNPYQGVMAIFIGNVLRNENITIFGDGKQSRDFIYIDDVVDVWIQSIENKKTFGKVFNLGFGKDISVNQLTTTIKETLHNTKKTIYKSARPGDQRHMRADITQIKKTLLWKPSFNLKKGLAVTLAWAKQEA